MANIYKSAIELIGNTPLVEVVNVERELGLEATVLVKLEYFNPAGSVKDRIAKSMLEDAENKGLLKENDVRRTSQHFEELWRGNRAHRRPQRDEGRY